MRLYWRERRAGQRLILFDDEASEIEVGAVRQTPRGFDALAKTNTYDPGRAQKGFSTLEEAKEFVEWFHPWDIFGGDTDLEVEVEVQSDPSGSGSAEPLDVSPEVPTDAPAGGADAEPTAPAQNVPEAEAPDLSESEESQSSGKGWRFWKKD